MLILPATSVLLLASCEKDDDTAYSCSTFEFGEAYFGTDSVMKYITTDDGKLISCNSNIRSTKPDTIMRCLCHFYVKENPLWLIDAYQVYCTYPQKKPAGKVILTDPFIFKSAWKSFKYINFQLAYMTNDKAEHSFGIFEDSIVYAPDGHKSNVYVTIAHRIPKEDIEAYSSDFYLSVPLKNYFDCDSMTISVNTYKEGRKTVSFKIKD